MTSDPLPHLETFTEAAERGTFSAAGRHLRITQAAVSQRIHQLETTVGTPLFRRTAKGVSLTEAGHKLHSYALKIVELTVAAREAISGEHRSVQGNLQLAASSIPGEYHLPERLAAFRSRYPSVQVQMSISDTGAVIREVERGPCQLGFVGGPGGSRNLVFQKFTTDELTLVVPPHHPWCRRRQVSPAELARQPLVQREAESGSRRCLERAMERVGIISGKLNVALELGSNEAIKSAVQAGLGVAVLSRKAVQNDLDGGKLFAVPVKDFPLVRDLYVVRDRRRVVPTPAQLFLEMITTIA